MLEPLRARKSPKELGRFERAIAITEQLLDEAGRFMRPGMTEREVAEFFKWRQRELGGTHSFSDGAAVMTGTAGLGHRTAGDAPLLPGDTVAIDTDVYVEGYTSDIIRMFYVAHPGEEAAPPDVQHRFDAVMVAGHESVAVMRPGVAGHEVDAVARRVLEERGITPYTHALGHQIGRTVHGGGITLAPLNDCYGDRRLGPLVESEVYTIESVVHGRAGVEGHLVGPAHDVVVTAEGVTLLDATEGAHDCPMTPRGTMLRGRPEGRPRARVPRAPR